jgi:glutathione-regulated potassium-efflux system ancillary protein KefF
MTQIELVYAHPYPDRSRANRMLLDGVRDVPGLTVRSLYELYPDFDIDAETERARIAAADVLVWQHPTYWYSVPALLKHWFDKVLTRGFAYGESGTALHGKRCLWVTTTGGNIASYRPGGMHEHPFHVFVPPIEQTARFCGMQWEEPLILHASHTITDEAVRDASRRFRDKLVRLGADLAA